MQRSFSIWIGRAALGACLLLPLAPAAMADTPPKVDRSYPTPEPNYPDAAQFRGEEGDVMVDVYVGPEGKPRKFRISHSSGFDDLDNAAVEAVAGWRFIPAIEEGDTASDWMTVKIHFALPKAEEAAAPPPTEEEHDLRDHCDRPASPPAIDRTKVTKNSLAEDHDKLVNFLRASDSYQACLRHVIGQREDLQMFVKSSVPAWMHKAVEKKIADNQKDKQLAGDDYNAVVQAFKERGDR